MNKNILRFKSGLKEIEESKWKLVFPIVFAIVIMEMFKTIIEFITMAIDIQVIKNLLVLINLLICTVVLLVGVVFIVSWMGRGHVEFLFLDKKLINIGMTDNLGNVPLLLSSRKKDQLLTIEFYSEYIPISSYKNHIDELETILNKDIKSIKYGDSKRNVIIECTEPMFKFPSIIEWNNTLLSNDEFKLVLGVSCLGVEYLNLNNYPHTLLGGGTGSGKTILFKLLLLQSLMKGAEICLFDYKKGVDFQGNWHSVCKVVTNTEDTEKELSNIISIMDERYSLLIKEKVTNINEYNEKVRDNQMKRFIVGIDEIGELLDKSSTSKEEDKLIKSIERKITKLARLGRASGIHLILCTQRPSTEVIKGEIKSNIGNRFCGKADSVLSKIILDNTDAPDMIPENEVGVFLSNSRTLFKSYFVSEQYIQQELGKIAKSKS